MEKNKVLGNQDNTKVIRILEVKESSFLVIDCIKRTMPQWKEKEAFIGWKSLTEQELWEITNIYPSKTDTALSTTSKYIQEHYSLIAGILPFIGDEKERSRMIRSIAELKNYSKQTIRNTLCLYLVYQDISVLAPKEKNEKELSRDEKIMRWSLNKFFYTKNQNTLTTAYTMMLKEKYTDAEGTLLPHPSIHQFRYFYKKTKKQQNFYISREGVKKYQRNRRPLLGEGVQEFASSIGMAMLDSTICDIYIVNERGELIGRPVLTACIDAYSSICCGYSLGWEGGIYSLRGLMLNVITDKVEHCRKYGIRIIAPCPYTKVNEETGEEEKRIFFRTTSVFDLSQTIQIPNTEEVRFGIEELTGDVPDYERLLNAIIATSTCPVSYTKPKGSIKGYYAPLEKKIVVCEGMSELQTIKTLLHEIAHSLLHNPEEMEERKVRRDMKEVEAESTAFIVATLLGLDTSDYSFEYIAGWNGKDNLKELSAAMKQVQDADFHTDAMKAEAAAKKVCETYKLDEDIETSKKFAAFCEFYTSRMSDEEIAAVAQDENK